MLLQEYPEQNRRRFTTAEDYVRALDPQLFRVNYGGRHLLEPPILRDRKDHRGSGG
jgi:hypothetical protein